LFLKVSPKIGDLLSRTPLRKIGAKQEESISEEEKTDLEDHVILVGYGPAGRNLAKVFKDTGIPFIVVEMNPKSVNEMRDEGINAVYGDASRSHIMEHAGVHKAKLCVVVINDP
ncbi:MAG TPA: sodium:proton exchanger, partial [Balneolaceae bacterium]|nr:sodium:proton exchanger [Balneolaceae bacterium]